MRNLVNPRWLLLINTLPILIVLVLYLSEYTIIESLLAPESILLWKQFGFALVSLGLLNLCYTIVLIALKRTVTFWYALIALTAYISFIYVYVNNVDEIIPFDIPQWMVSDDIMLYAGTFLMPTLAYAILVMVLHITPKSKEKKAWKNFVAALVIPISWYLFAQIISPLWQPVSYMFSTHLGVIFGIVGTVLFLLFLSRGVFILVNKKGSQWKKYQLLWKIPIGIVLPLIGLATNNGFLFGEQLFNSTGIFGNFNSFWFYGLAIVNGVLLCLPELENTIYRLVLFTARSLTFSYTFYFFMVFLPFLPVSVVAIVALGIGFLMLSPLVLFILHLKELSNDFNFLTRSYSKHRLRAVALIGFLVIPFLITSSYLSDKNTLEQTLSYVYTPNYSKQYDIDKTSLKHTLEVIKQHKDRNNSFIFGNQTPYLSTYFKWLVLDNLTLSDTKIGRIEHIFFGASSSDVAYSQGRSIAARNENVSISDISTKSSYNSKLKEWTSWIDIEITNSNEQSWMAEYSTVFTLPEGCWIKDYYLYVGDRKEMGMLAEKKSAMWVFSQIRNENKDPGILYYLTGNDVSFRVFPFADNEVRKTGIQLIHKQPVKLQIDDHILNLGDDNRNDEEAIFENEFAAYISSKHKNTLAKIERSAYYHFIVDASEASKDNIQKFIGRIETLMIENPSFSKNAKISYTNTDVHTVSVQQNWQGLANQIDFEGGYNLDRALKKTLSETYVSRERSYPILIAVTDRMESAILDKGFSDFKMTFPESDYFYRLNEKGALETHSLLSKPEIKMTKNQHQTFKKSVLEFTHLNGSKSYLADNGKTSIAMSSTFPDFSESHMDKSWESGLIMQAHWMAQTLNPESAEKDWLKLVKSSFVSKIMTPVTSYLVVENDAQKAILRKKQEQVLSGNKSFDLDEDAQRMSEPGLWLLGILVFVFIWLKKKSNGMALGS